MSQENINCPQERELLESELATAENLGQTADGKLILLVSAEDGSAILEEIGRLREEAFRAVGEGTGGRRDTDCFDRYYRHIVLWDEKLLQIVGAYRLGEIWAWSDKDAEKLYSNTLFSYQETAHPLFESGLELGRSFVQPQFWGKFSLDYLWQGIGAYVSRHPQVRYLFGPVSMSPLLSDLAKALLVRFYALHYPDRENLAKSRQPFCPLPQQELLAKQLILGLDRDADFIALRERLDYLGVRIPTLFKQYSEVCTPSGVRFSDFNVDPNFNYCVDGLVFVDLKFLKNSKRKRYMNAT